MTEQTTYWSGRIGQTEVTLTDSVDVPHYFNES